MNASSPRLIAVGFYDGPTEGFVRGFETGFAHYFKVVAWDDEQDCRLYLLGRIEEFVFDQLLALLLEGGQAILGEVFAPAWKFGDANREAQACAIVEKGRRTLNSPTFVVLGKSLLGDFEVIDPTELQLKRAVALSRLKTPGTLDEWIAL